jgi:hypothetical protein
MHVFIKKGKFNIIAKKIIGGRSLKPSFFIISYRGYIIPIAYHNYENACANCGADEIVFLSSSLEELEACLEKVETI